MIYDEDLEPLREYEDELQGSPLPGTGDQEGENNLSFSRHEDEVV